MHWTSFADFAEFAAMGGYGLYVWGSFGMAAAALAWEAFALRQRRRDAVDELRAELSRTARG